MSSNSSKATKKDKKGKSENPLMPLVKTLFIPKRDKIDMSKVWADQLDLNLEVNRLVKSVDRIEKMNEILPKLAEDRKEADDEKDPFIKWFLNTRLKILRWYYGLD